MADQFLLGNLDGITRLRTVRPGYDVMNPSLDERFITFDSTRVNSMRLLANGDVVGLTNFTVTYPNYAGFTVTRKTKILNVAGNNAFRPTLAWVKRGAGSFFYTPQGGSQQARSYQVGYGTCGVTLRTNTILLSPQRSDTSYVYYIFGNNGSSSEGGGSNSAILGNHPLYGQGLFISRPGFDVDNAGLGDMMLSTRNNFFQLFETGTAVHTGTISTNPLGDPEMASTVLTCGIVTLAGSYPHYPPVIAYSMRPNASIDYMGCQIYWLSANQLLITGTGADGYNVRFAVVSTDPAYQGGIDAGPGYNRCFVSPETGLIISKHNVNADTSGINDRIFDSKRLSPYIKGYSSINAAQATNNYLLPNPPPSGAGAPFSFFLMQDQQSAEWWCGCGHISTKNVLVFNSTTSQYLAYPAPRGNIISPTVYAWNRPSDYTSNAPGFVATMNVSDF